jgi:hypothetical protein
VRKQGQPGGGGMRAGRHLSESWYQGGWLCMLCVGWLVVFIYMLCDEEGGGHDEIPSPR